MAAPIPPGPPSSGPPRGTLPACYRHAERIAGVVCQRCDRPICPQCMHQASVGFHCPECRSAGRQRVYQGSSAMAIGSRPLLTLILILVNVAVFVMGLALTGSRATTGGNELALDFGLIAELRSGVPFGVGQGEWYRLLTAGFLHYGLFHLGMNMYALYVLGGQLEAALGRLRFAVLYVVSLLTGSLGALLLTPRGLTAGASGAIYGLLGCLVAYYRARGIPLRQSPVFGVLLLNLVFTLGVPGISIGGHLGGFVGGLVVMTLFVEVPRRLPRAQGTPPARAHGISPGDAVAIALSALLGASTIVAALVLF